nr:MAG TPA: hypothetical protein [Caudoviricetes sp.]
MQCFHVHCILSQPVGGFRRAVFLCIKFYTNLP